MTLDNSKSIIGMRIKLFGATLLLLSYLAVAYIIKLVKFPLLGMSDTGWTIIFIGIWLLLAFLPMILNYQYVSFSDNGDYFVFRYFTSGLVGGKKNSIEIRKDTFGGFRTEKRFFGLIESLVLLQKIQDKVAKYPPIYISALSRTDRQKIFDSLNRAGYIQ